MKVYFLFIIINTISFFNVYSDTIRIMHYNLLYYGHNTSWCDETNNSITEKDSNISTILQYAKPDIFTVNEMSSDSTYCDRLLDSVINPSLGNNYKRAKYSNQAISSIINMLYYNSSLFTLIKEYNLNKTVRDISLYHMYYNDLSKDTIYINFIVVHLKSGSDANNLTLRETMISNTLQSLENLHLKGNYILLGDFNTRSSDEQSYRLLTDTNSAYCFYDPINQNGEWHNNYEYRHLHTQSTRIQSEGCAVIGGLNDRYDFILADKKTFSSTSIVRYIENSYTALGQDGHRYNSSLLSPSNYSAPSEVLNALYNNSDHLPVMLDIYIDIIKNEIRSHSIIDFQYSNPVKNEMNLIFNSTKNDKIQIQILNLSGICKHEETILISMGRNRKSITIPHLKNQLYILVIKNETNLFSTNKLLIIP